VDPDIVAVADRMLSPMVFLEPMGTIRYANPAAGWLLGRAPLSLRGLDVTRLVHPGDRRQARQDLIRVIAGQSLGPAEYRVRAADGSYKTVSALAADLLDSPAVKGVLISATDVTDQRAQERSLLELALADPVTGLANRRALREHLEREMATAKTLAVAFVDLDRFKRVNDCLGHTVGDAVLQAVASRIRALLAPESMVSHFGADNFVAVITGLDPERAVRLIWEMIGHVASPLFVSGHELRLAASAGVAVRDPAATPESILRDADAALTYAKAFRRGGVEVFTEEMRTRAVDRLAMETDLRHAVERDELRLYFQPIVRLSDSRSEGGEALLRWDRPGYGLVAPGAFIPLAEESGLIVPIGEWALANVVRTLQLGHLPKASVNLSPRQLLDPGLPARIEGLLKSWDLAPQALAFEVTETVVVENFELASASLSRLRRLGCTVGLDDFGTGYSSLGYLRRLPVDFLKLDLELVHDLGSDPQAARIAEAIVSLAHSLSLATIAEGIEDQGQAEALTAMGCDCGQGWLFGRPCPV
jgi:diguanylate cyclase (GGDEF)-like protein/PAS domain S-box-containing protein